MEDFKFGNFWLSQFGGRLLQKPKIEIAQKAIELIEVPGRDGMVIQDLGFYRNVEFERKICLLSTVTEKASRDLIDSLIDWLAYSTGYQEFRDTQHNGFFTKSVLTNMSAVERELRIYSTATLKFNRIPFWYDDKGQTVKSFILNSEKNSIELFNPTLTESQYTMNIYTETTKGATIGININNSIYYFDKPSGYEFVEIDVENQSVKSKKSTGEFNISPPGSHISYKKNYVPSTLLPGENKIVFDTTSTNPPVKVEIKPNWRKL